MSLSSHSPWLQVASLDQNKRGTLSTEQRAVEIVCGVNVDYSDKDLHLLDLEPGWRGFTSK